MCVNQKIILKKNIKKLIYSYIIICELKVSGMIFSFLWKMLFYIAFLHIIVSLKTYVAYKKKRWKFTRIGLTCYYQIISLKFELSNNCLYSFRE